MEQKKCYQLPRSAEIQFDNDITAPEIKEIVGEIINNDDIIIIFTAPKGHHLSVCHIPHEIGDVSVLRCMVRAQMYALTKEQHQIVDPSYQQLIEASKRYVEAFGMQHPIFAEQFREMMRSVIVARGKLSVLPSVYLYYKHQSAHYHRIQMMLKQDLGYNNVALEEKIYSKECKTGMVLIKRSPNIQIGEQLRSKDCELVDLPYCPEILELCYTAAQWRTQIFRVVTVDKTNKTERCVMLGDLQIEMFPSQSDLRKEIKSEFLEHLVDTAAVVDREFMINRALVKCMPDQAQNVRASYADKIARVSAGRAVCRILCMMRILMPKNPEDRDFKLMSFFIFHSHVDSDLFLMMKKLLDDPRAQSKQHIDPVFAWMQDIVAWIGAAKPLENEQFFDLFIPSFRFLLRYPALCNIDKIEAGLKEKISIEHLESFKSRWGDMRASFGGGERNISVILQAKDRDLVTPQHNRLKTLIRNWGSLELVQRPIGWKEQAISLVYPMTSQKSMRILVALLYLFQFYTLMRYIFNDGPGVARTVYDLLPEWPSCDDMSHVRNCEL